MKLCVQILVRYQRNVAFVVSFPSNSNSTVSSDALPAMTAAERSTQHVESKDSAMESESDAEAKGYLSENDWEPYCQ